MALKDITSQKDLIEEANRTRQKRVEEGNQARADQREEARKANNLRERRQSMNVAYSQFKNSGTKGIDTKPGMIEKLFGATENAPKYQAAREMKSALEHERARVNIPEALDEIRSSGETKLKKGGSVSSASKRADGCAVRGKTRA